MEAPTPEELAQREHVADSLAQIEIQEQAAQAEKSIASLPVADSSIATTNVTVIDTVGRDSAQQVQLAGRYGIFHPSASGSNKVFILENDVVSLEIGAKGGAPKIIRMKQYEMYQGGPQLLADPDSSRFEYRFFLGDRDLSTQELYFTKESATANELRLRAKTSSPSKYLELVYSLTGGSYLADVSLEIHGLSEEIDPSNTFFQWEMMGLKTEKPPPDTKAEINSILQVLQR